MGLGFEGISSEAVEPTRELNGNASAGIVNPSFVGGASETSITVNDSSAVDAKPQPLEAIGDLSAADLAAVREYLSTSNYPAIRELIRTQLSPTQPDA